nr:suppressor of mec-8 and unc-52 protein homolog 2 [Tanacetum cinerariifolium]
MGSSNKVQKNKQARRPKDEKKKKVEESAAAALELLPKYRDRAKERREDQNPDYEPTANEFGAF